MSLFVADAAALVGRSLRHSVRSVDALITAIVLPVILLLLFVYVFGGALGSGEDYVEYVVPGIVLLCAGFGAASTAVSVNDDMTRGVIDRFRTLDVSGPAVVGGHVVASVLRNVVSTALVVGVALAIGFSPSAGVLDWVVVAGVLVLFMAAVAWLAAAFGLLAASAETANAFTFLVMFLPYVSSAFVEPATMPAGLEWVAERQPVTPVIETLRGLLTGGGAAGADVAAAVAWCGGAIVVGVVASAVLFRRRTAG